ncbi:hypothetical protein BP6252_02262 [Coleophoma cylindrospora]|uniref:Uncharacterized protein n=1 Tax=Coleophoma cylindrospora TaxID=1849047 RepID=A0A3D8SED0_9HELO|nr:hypothetical protein BP6252_02262 [Coleophoma cylindrospora]
MQDASEFGGVEEGSPAVAFAEGEVREREGASQVAWAWSGDSMRYNASLKGAQSPVTNSEKAAAGGTGGLSQHQMRDNGNWGRCRRSTPLHLSTSPSPRPLLNPRQGRDEKDNLVSRLAERKIRCPTQCDAQGGKDGWGSDSPPLREDVDTVRPARMENCKEEGSMDGQGVVQNHWSSQAGRGSPRSRALATLESVLKTLRTQGGRRRRCAAGGPF